jgi:glutamine amidotransferase
MQMLFDESEEFGKTEGLGLLKGRVRRFPNDLPGNLAVPQVGWNQVRHRGKNALMANIPDYGFFYFVHSYFCEAADSGVVIGETDYGMAYPSVVAQENVYGVQFHPEKSQTAGLRLLANFAGVEA